MGYDRGDSFPFDFESNVIPFGSKSKEKLSPWSYPIQFERNWKYTFLSEPSQINRFWNTVQFNKLDCNCAFPIEFALNRIPFGAKLIVEKCKLRLKFGVIQQDPESGFYARDNWISHCKPRLEFLYTRPRG